MERFPWQQRALQTCFVRVINVSKSTWKKKDNFDWSDSFKSKIVNLLILKAQEEIKKKLASLNSSSTFAYRPLVLPMLTLSVTCKLFNHRRIAERRKGILGCPWPLFCKPFLVAKTIWLSSGTFTLTECAPHPPFLWKIPALPTPLNYPTYLDISRRLHSRITSIGLCHLRWSNHSSHGQICILQLLPLKTKFKHYM